MIEKIQRNRKVIATGLLFLFLSIAHTPVAIFPHIFDKNAAPQFIALMAIAICIGTYILIRNKSFLTHTYIRWTLWTVLGILTTSALLSANIISSFTGDTGRYAGVVSLLALIIVAIFHAQFSFSQINKLIFIYVGTTFLVVLIGIAQYFNLFELPGDHGLTSTLGNQDFYAAYIGITMPLYFFLALRASRKVRYILGGAVIISFYSLYLATPLQAYVDIAFTLIGIAIFAVRRRLPRLSISLNKRNFLGTFALIIWAEFIFLVPFLGSWIPVLGNDVQVKIRANFWLAGMRQFLSHPFLGVGPDQYGNFYEQYRTLSDAQTYEKILANDAHSASIQTLATLGIIGTLLLLALITILVRAFLILWDNNPKIRYQLFALGLFFFVYMTNSFVSPMAKPSKYLLWALAGWVVGAVYRTRDENDSVGIRMPVAIAMAFILFVGAQFSFAQWNYSRSFESYATSQSQKHEYAFNPYIPCVMYFEGEFHINEKQNIDHLLELAQNQLEANPRCISAHLILAQYYKGVGNTEALGRQLEQMLMIAPMRTEVITMALEYASQVGDFNLYNQLQARFAKLGLIYVPGKTS